MYQGSSGSINFLENLSRNLKKTFPLINIDYHECIQCFVNKTKIIRKNNLHVKTKRMNLKVETNIILGAPATWFHLQRWG